MFSVGSSASPSSVRAEGPSSARPRATIRSSTTGASSSKRAVRAACEARVREARNDLQRQARSSLRFALEEIIDDELLVGAGARGVGGAGAGGGGGGGGSSVAETSDAWDDAAEEDGGELTAAERLDLLLHLQAVLEEEDADQHVEQRERLEEEELAYLVGLGDAGGGGPGGMAEEEAA